MSKQARLLIKTLRHDLVKIGLRPCSDGYVKVTDVLEKVPGLESLTVEAIQEIVASDDKGRFSLKCVDGIWHIRANQGHSRAVGDYITSDECMTLLTVPVVGAFHGSYRAHYQSILAHGLQAMTRKHIHIAKSLDAKSGQRRDCNMRVFVDIAAAMRDGIKFYESSNGVILTEGPLAPQYLSFEFTDSKKKLD